LTLVALPIVGVLNGWFAATRWPVRKIELRAEYAHVSAEQIRATVEAHLGKGFFAVQLQDVRDAVSRLPWVERVEARKQWPDTLSLTVYERQPFARWGDTRLISRSGDLFEVPGTDAMQGLPQLSGPDARLAEVIAFHGDCLREFSGSGLNVQAVDLSARGSWRLTLSSGALIEIGRVDAMQRLQRFLNAWPQLSAGNAGPPVYIDLRYENGFAMRWALPEPAAPDGNRESDIGNRAGGAAVKPASADNFPIALLTSIRSPFPIDAPHPAACLSASCAVRSDVLSPQSSTRLLP
ncbi:cell division protein FtsQ/DivIB, partial [Dokdonella sp.]|uniref:cell division protein FtsQ/DivIB n=1 Tax=Dokdonella sp. TaxID=2291710 RepID=UPI003BB0454E